MSSEPTFKKGDMVMCTDHSTKPTPGIVRYGTEVETNAPTLYWVDFLVPSDGVPVFYPYELRLLTDFEKALYE